MARRIACPLRTLLYITCLSEMLDLSWPRSIHVKGAAYDHLMKNLADFWGGSVDMQPWLAHLHKVSGPITSDSPLIFVDVGAGTAYREKTTNSSPWDNPWAFEVARLWGCGPDIAILCFEPQDHIREKSIAWYEKMMRRHGLRDATCFEWHGQALSDKTRDMRLRGNGDTASLEKLGWHLANYGKEFFDGVNVAASSLDDFLSSRFAQKGRVVAIKVDTEGHESSVLNGMVKLIESGRGPQMLFLEVNAFMNHIMALIQFGQLDARREAHAAVDDAEEKGPTLRSMQKWLDRQGYDAFLIGGSDRLLPIGGESWDDRFELCLHTWVEFRNSPVGSRIAGAFGGSPYCWLELVGVRKDLRSSLFESPAVVHRDGVFWLLPTSSRVSPRLSIADHARLDQLLRGCSQEWHNHVRACLEKPPWLKSAELTCLTDASHIALRDEAYNSGGSCSLAHFFNRAFFESPECPAGAAYTFMTAMSQLVCTVNNGVRANLSQNVRNAAIEAEMFLPDGCNHGCPPLLPKNWLRNLMDMLDSKL